ncbi:MAG: hypothetical protein AAF988_00100 [Pseudomonadota bacterium]
MSESGKIVLFLAALPFFLALGHDIYLNFFSSDEKVAQFQSLDVNPEDFQFADTGWALTQYANGLYEMIRDAASEEQWNKMVVPVLKTKASITTLFPIGILVIYYLFAWMIGIWPFAHLSRFSNKKDKGVKSIRGHDVANTKKYNRK